MNDRSPRNEVASRQLNLVTFGTPNFSQARARYLRSARRFGFDRPFVFGPDDEPVQRARRENPEIFAHARGYGYWLWKPYIIEAAMAAAPPGAAVLYSDIACEMVGSVDALLGVAGPRDICTFRIGTGMLQSAYTKRDAFVLLDADREEFWADEQVNGGFLLLRNTPRARAFVEEWRRAMADPRVLSDTPSTQGLPELPGFKAHRHDQSVLSILATRHRLPILADPTQWGRDRRGRTKFDDGSSRLVRVDYARVFNHHRQRDRPWHRRLASHVKHTLLSALKQ